MNVVCSAVQVALPTVGEAAITGPIAAHVETCVPCQGEVVTYRVMYRELGALDHSRYRAPYGTLTSVMTNLGPVAVETDGFRRDPRVPVAAAAVVATADAGTAVLYRLYRQHAA